VSSVRSNATCGSRFSGGSSFATRFRFDEFFRASAELDFSFVTTEASGRPSSDSSVLDSWRTIALDAAALFGLGSALATFNSEVASTSQGLLFISSSGNIMTSRGTFFEGDCETHTYMRVM